MKSNKPTLKEMGLHNSDKAGRYSEIKKEAANNKMVSYFNYQNKTELDKIWREIEVLCFLIRENPSIENMARLEYLTFVYCNTDATADRVIVYSHTPIRYYELVENIYSQNENEKNN